MHCLHCRLLTKRKGERVTTSETSQVAETTEQRVVELLRERILEGQLAIGERLRQDAVSAELGVSSTPVREAFRRLAAEGLLTIASHKGALVRDLSHDERVEVLDLLRLIDSYNLARAIPNSTAAVIEEATRIQDELRSTSDSARWATLNRRFHLVLGEPSGRPRSLALLREMLNLSALHIREDIASVVGRREQALEEHDRILASYAAGDVAACQAAARAHTSSALDRLLAR
jgi:DNA-binding GntR family transcriptional regulator